ETQVRLDSAEQAVTQGESELDNLANATIPSIVDDLEAADQAAAQELATLDGKLNTLDGVVEGKPDFDDLTVGNLLAGSVSAPEAVIDKLWADGIAAKSIAATRITVASSSERIIPNSLLLEDLEFWRGSASTERVPIAGVEGVTHALRSSKGSGKQSPYSGPMFPVTPGGTYLFEFWMRADVAGSNIFIELRDQDGNHASGRTAQGAKGPNRQLSPNPSSETNYLIGSEPVPTAWTKYQVQVNMNTETTLARVASFYFNHTGGSVADAQVWVAGMSLRPMASSVLIEPGAITTEKLTV